MEKKISIAIAFGLLLNISSFAQAVKGKFIKHSVEFSETIYSIPVHYGMTTKEFLEANNFPVDVVLTVGQTVLIREMSVEELRLAKLKDEKLTPEKRTNLHSIDQDRMEAKVQVESMQPVKGIDKVNVAVVKKPETVAVQPTQIPTRAKALPTAEITEDIGPNGIAYKISKDGQHKVEKKQTAFHIAQIYNVSLDDLKNWNNLASTDIQIGQVLIVSN